MGPLDLPAGIHVRQGFMEPGAGRCRGTLEGISKYITVLAHVPPRRGIEVSLQTPGRCGKPRESVVS